MHQRTQRLATGVALLVVLLFVGRWTATFLSERWWAATISPAALAAVTRWHLLGFLLAALAIGVSAAWFALQAILVARAIASVQVMRQIGNLRVREAVPTRLLLFGAVATGILLGLVTGAGAQDWRGPFLLAWQGVSYGTTDPVLHRDLGVYVGLLPLWNALHQFATLLAVVGVCFVAVLYAGIGGIRREGGQVSVHPYARRHVGLLLVLFAVLIGVGYLLAPFHFVSAAPRPVSTAAVATRVRAAQVMAGVAFGIGLLTLLWIRHGRHSLLASGWAVLALGGLIERIVVPALAAEAPAASTTDATLRDFDALAWGIRQSPPPPSSDTLPPVTAIWDESTLARFLVATGAQGVAFTPTLLRRGGAAVPAWLVAATVGGAPGRLDLIAVAEGTGSANGTPQLIPSADTTDPSGTWRTVGSVRVVPGATGWLATTSGIAPRGTFDRLLMAWGRQAGGLLGGTRGEHVDWHLDPVERADAILPIASWSTAEIVVVDGTPTWVLQGSVVLDEFPLAQKTSWGTRTVAGVVPAFVATINPRTGSMAFYFDPGADSTAVAWARAFPGLIRPAAALPTDVRDHLPYPRAWLAAQLRVLEAPEWGLGELATRGPEGSEPAGPATIWLPALRPGRQAAFADPAGLNLAALVSGFRDDAGVPTLRIEHPSGTAPGGRELERLWDRMPWFLHLRDSATAVGDSVVIGAVRWFVGARGTTGWQPLVSVPSPGVPALLGIATSVGLRLGGGRTVSEGWQSVTGSGTVQVPVGPTEAQLLSQARLWLRQADSALAHGDLAGFARAFDALRAALQRSTH